MRCTTKESSCTRARSRTECTCPVHGIECAHHTRSCLQRQQMLIDCSNRWELSDTLDNRRSAPHDARGILSHQQDEDCSCTYKIVFALSQRQELFLPLGRLAVEGEAGDARTDCAETVTITRLWSARVVASLLLQAVTVVAIRAVVDACPTLCEDVADVSRGRRLPTGLVQQECYRCAHLTRSR